VARAETCLLLCSTLRWWWLSLPPPLPPSLPPLLPSPLPPPPSPPRVFSVCQTEPQATRQHSPSLLRAWPHETPRFAQLLPNGALDVSFGEAGFVSVKPIPNFIANPASMVLLPDGSAIQGGLTQPGVLVGTGMLVDAYWLKVDASGRPDARFGNSGLLIWNAGPQGFDGQNNVGAMAAIGASGDQFASCQYWMNRTAPSVVGVAQLASQQSIVQWRATSTGELLTQYANGGTGWLPRDNDPSSELWNRCIGLRVGKDSKLLALVELGAVNKASTPMFAVARIK
jgi:hypothetical protein